VKLLDKCNGGRWLSVFLAFADAMKSGRAHILLLDIACIVEWMLREEPKGMSLPYELLAKDDA
jgi:hypothetical protein